MTPPRGDVVAVGAFAREIQAFPVPHLGFQNGTGKTMESSSSSANASSVFSPDDRLRIYRRCFHDLEEQLFQMQQEGLGSTAEYNLVQAEVRSLEDLIMLFTNITSVLPSLAPKTLTFDPPIPGVDGLNLSLVTDILMLSATSPWTVFVAERSQWQICYVSPSVKRMFGWKASELIGVSAWDGCHTEDIANLQRMLLLKESSLGGNPLLYRRLRKDRTYATVQATGRAVGNKWYAWVEQDTLTNTPCPMELPLSLPATRRSKPSESDSVMRSRKTRPATIEAEMNPRFNNASRPASPLASVPGLKPQKIKVEPVENGENAPLDASLDECQKNFKAVLAASNDNSSSYTGNENADKTKKGRPSDEPAPKPKAPAAPSQVGSSTNQVKSDKFDLLWAKKILLVEDDRVNRTIAQRLLENLKCEVTVACNGQEALDILQQAPPIKQEDLDGKEIPPQFDLVLMDLLMPVMDGTKAVQYFRDWEAEQEPPRKRMTIFALTSNVSDGDMVKCAISGFDEFVCKPLTIDKLLDRLTSSKQ